MAAAAVGVSSFKRNDHQHISHKNVMILVEPTTTMTVPHNSGLMSQSFLPTTVQTLEDKKGARQTHFGCANSPDSIANNTDEQNFSESRSLARERWYWAYHQVVLKIKRERLRDMKRMFMFHPNSKLIYRWGLFLVLLSLWSGISTPFYLVLDYNPTGVLLGFEILMDLIFLFNIILNFRIGYLKESSLILRPRLVAIRYIKHGLLFDCISSIPSSLIAATTGDSNPLAVLRVLRVLKMTRMLRISRARVLSDKVRLAKLLFWFVLASYWIGMLYLALQEYQDWVITSYVDPKLKDMAIHLKIMHCLFWGFANLLSMGANLKPETENEFILSYCVVLGGIGVVASILGNMNAIIARLDVKDREFSEERNSLFEFLKSNNIRAPMRSRALKYFDAYSTSKFNFSSANGVLSSMPGVMQVDIMREIYHKFFSSCPVFERFEPGMLNYLCTVIHMQISLEGDSIVRKGDRGNSMFFLYRGSCRVVSEDFKTIAFMEQGSYFGEVALLTEGVTRTATVVALSNCELFELYKHDFDLGVQAFPNARETLRTIAHQRLSSKFRSSARDQKMARNGTGKMDLFDLVGTLQSAAVLDDDVSRARSLLGTPSNQNSPREPPPPTPSPRRSSVTERAGDIGLARSPRTPPPQPQLPEKMAMRLSRDAVIFESWSPSSSCDALNDDVPASAPEVVSEARNLLTPHQAPPRRRNSSGPSTACTGELTPTGRDSGDGVATGAGADAEAGAGAGGGGRSGSGFRLVFPSEGDALGWHGDMQRRLHGGVGGSGGEPSARTCQQHHTVGAGESWEGSASFTSPSSAALVSPSRPTPPPTHVHLDVDGGVSAAQASNSMWC